LTPSHLRNDNSEERFFDSKARFRRVSVPLRNAGGFKVQEAANREIGVPGMRDTPACARKTDRAAALKMTSAKKQKQIPHTIRKWGGWFWDDSGGYGQHRENSPPQRDEGGAPAIAKRRFNIAIVA
jgi:hypothetical protein